MPMLRVDKVSVVMPTYNEAGHIGDLVAATLAALEQCHLQDMEIIVVDDNSPDETWKIAEAISKQDHRVKCIRRLQERGLTNSLTEGISNARFDIVVWLDCDFSHPPARIPALLGKLGEGYDVVVNSRYIKGGSESRQGKGGALQLMFSFMLNKLACFVLDSRFTDYTSGFVVVRKSVLDAIPLRGDYGEYFMDFLYRAIKQNYRVCEIPYHAQVRRSGESKTGSSLLDYARRGSKYLATLVRLRVNQS